jgi:membrane protease YdiL (CAAX protease family)
MPELPPRGSGLLIGQGYKLAEPELVNCALRCQRVPGSSKGGLGLKTAFENFIEPARAGSGIWRLVVGLGLIAIGLVIWLVVVVIGFLIPPALDGMPLRAGFAAIESVSTPTDSRGLIFQHFLFVGIWISVWLVVTFLHKQHFSTLFAPAGSFRLRDFFDGLMLAVAIWLATTIPIVLVYGLPDRSALTLSSWTTTLLPLTVGLALGAGAEELIFRGYMLQQLAVRWRSPIAWAGVTRVLFVSINGNGDFLYIVSLLAYGLLSAALVWRTGSLLAPIGCHIGVNFFVYNVIRFEGTKSHETELFVFQGISLDFAMIYHVTAIILLLLFVVSPFFPERRSGERR